MGTNGECTGRDDVFSLGETLRRLSGLGTSPQDLARLGDLGAPDGSAAAATGETTTPAPRRLGEDSCVRPGG